MDPERERVEHRHSQVSPFSFPGVSLLIPRLIPSLHKLEFWDLQQKKDDGREATSPCICRQHGPQKVPFSNHRMKMVSKPTKKGWGERRMR